MSILLGGFISLAAIAMGIVPWIMAAMLIQLVAEEMDTPAECFCGLAFAVIFEVLGWVPCWAVLINLADTIGAIL